MSRARPLAVFVLILLPAVATAQEPVKIGERVGKLTVTDIRSLPRTLDDFGPKKAVVLVFTDTSCPLAQKYLPVLRAMAREYRDRGVQFAAVNAAAEDTVIDVAAQAVKYEIDFPFVKDFDGVCARALGVRRTPEAVVLDGDKRLRYRGRIDDQYRLGGSRPEPTKHELRDALDAVLAGKPVAVAETEADGCAITFPQPRQPKAVTFAEHVAPILKKHCWECHQPGGSAPFALTAAKPAAGRAAAIAEVVRDQRMPPWFASHDSGPFVNRRALTDEEKATLADWAKTGAAAGDLAKAPAPPAEKPGEWRIGTPDLVLTTAALAVPAAGDVPYKYAILPYVFTEDTWVRDVQIKPDNPRVLHHGNMAYASLTEGFNEANFITGYVPGGEPANLDDGVAVLIPKGSVLGLQLHLVTTGKPETCKVSVGLRYPREVVQKRLRNLQLADHRFRIPPGDPAHKVTAARVLDADAIGVGLFSHMHLRGKDMAFTAKLPDGTIDPLLTVANYNFAWQIPYRWEPGKKVLPKGTKLECVAHFDNSAFNPYNPDPTATVRDGPQTYHEMMVGFFFYTDAVEKLNLHVDPKTGHVVKPAGPR